MSENSHSSILHRMVGPPKGAAQADGLTAARALKVAVVKTALDAVGMTIAVKEMQRAVQPLEAMLAGLDPALMLTWLKRDAHPVGLIALDGQMRAALLEVQTTGQVAETLLDDRPATGTDQRLCRDFMDALLRALPEAARGGDFETCFDQVIPDNMIANTKHAGLVLEDGDYAQLTLSIDLGGADRVGQIILMVPPRPADPVLSDAPPADVDWATAFGAAVARAPVTFEAILHRFDLPLRRAEQLKVGEVLPLPGCTVSSVRMLALDGQEIAQARLGQMGGKRALRLEAAPMLQMDELAGVAGALNGAAGGLMGLPQMDDAPDLDGLGDDALDLPMGGLDDLPATDDLDLPMGDLPDLPMGDLPDLPMADDLPDLGDLPQPGAEDDPLAGLMPADEDLPDL